MISPEHVRTMAHYNRWQNRSIYTAASTLSEEARKQDRGAFFGSIHGTLSHLVWGDQMWMHRFAGTPLPGASSIADSPNHFATWDDLMQERTAFDEVIVDWAMEVAPNWLSSDLSWHSKAANTEMTRPAWLLVAHMFNHQTHHRGQVHAMLTAAGAKPDDTDIILMPTP